MENRRPYRASWGLPWVALTAALAVHVVDEAMNDFLSLWNPLVLRIRDQFSWSPLPTFSFAVWATGLAVLVVVLGILAIFAFRGSRWLRPLAYALAVIMIFNGLGHLVASVYLGGWVPGVYSSPLLLAAGGWLLASLVGSRPSRRASSTPSPR